MRLALVLLFVACSSRKPNHVDDARHHDTASADAGSGSSGSGSSSSSSEPAPIKQTTGDVQIRVEWPSMPRAARVSPGTSTCNTPLAAQVSPTTTWGIPEVIVFVEGAPASPHIDARVALDRCSVTPRVVIGSRVAIESAADQPIKATVVKRFSASDTKRAAKGTPTSIALPVVGHEVTTALDDDGIYRVAPDGKDIDDAYVVSATAFITDATGVALIKDVPPGKHAVRVWLPPRGGQPARSAKGEVTVDAGDLADLTLTLE